LNNRIWLSTNSNDDYLIAIEYTRGELGIPSDKKCMLVEHEPNKHILKIDYNLNGIWMYERIINNVKFFQIELPNGGLKIDSPGEPQIPQEGLFIAVPNIISNLKINLINKYSKFYQLDYHLIPIIKQTKTLDENFKLADIYKNDIYYPEYIFQNLGFQKISGINVIHLMLYPLQYSPKYRKIKLFYNFSLKISYNIIEKSKISKTYISDSQKRRIRIPPTFKDSILNLDNLIKDDF